MIQCEHAIGRKMMKHIRNGRTRLTIIIALITMAACASGPRIITNSAPDFSVANYQTFGFLQPLSSDRGTVRSLISLHLIEAATRELETTGLQFSEDNPDLLVNFMVSTRETIQSRPSTSVGMHHGHGRYGTWGGYNMSMSTTEIVQRTEGTIDVDIIDASQNQLVWEGAAAGRVTDSTRDNLKETVDRAISDIFAQFP
jgi:hypothetical protein